NPWLIGVSSTEAGPLPTFYVLGGYGRCSRNRECDRCGWRHASAIPPTSQVFKVATTRLWITPSPASDAWTSSSITRRTGTTRSIEELVGPLVFLASDPPPTPRARSSSSTADIRRHSMCAPMVHAFASSSQDRPPEPFVTTSCLMLAVRREG